MFLKRLLLICFINKGYGTGVGISMCIDSPGHTSLMGRPGFSDTKVSSPLSVDFAQSFPVSHITAVAFPTGSESKDKVGF